MISGVQQTSLLSFQEHLESGKLGEQQVKVLECLRTGGIFDKQYRPLSMNDKMISHKTGMPINVVTARRNELVKQGLVVEDCKGNCPFTRKLTIFWRFQD